VNFSARPGKSILIFLSSTWRREPVIKGPRRRQKPFALAQSETAVSQLLNKRAAQPESFKSPLGFPMLSLRDAHDLQRPVLCAFRVSRFSPVDQSCAVVVTRRAWMSGGPFQFESFSRHLMGKSSSSLLRPLIGRASLAGRK